MELFPVKIGNWIVVIDITNLKEVVLLGNILNMSMINRSSFIILIGWSFIVLIHVDIGKIISWRSAWYILGLQSRIVDVLCYFFRVSPSTLSLTSSLFTLVFSGLWIWFVGLWIPLTKSFCVVISLASVIILVPISKCSKTTSAPSSSVFPQTTSSLTSTTSSSAETSIVKIVKTLRIATIHGTIIPVSLTSKSTSTSSGTSTTSESHIGSSTEVLLTSATSESHIG